MVERILAGIVFAVCVGWLLWLFAGRWLPAGRRSRLQASLQSLWRWPQRRRAARLQARQVIERVRRNVERNGNVYRPKSFSGKPPADADNDELH